MTVFNYCSTKASPVKAKRQSKNGKRLRPNPIYTDNGKHYAEIKLIRNEARRVSEKSESGVHTAQKQYVNSQHHRDPTGGISTPNILSNQFGLKRKPSELIKQFSSSTAYQALKTKKSTINLENMNQKSISMDRKNSSTLKKSL